MSTRATLSALALAGLALVALTGCHRRARPTVVVAPGGAVVASAVSHRHHRRLVAVAARDLSCAPGAVATTEVSPGIFSAQGCGAVRDYVMVCGRRRRCAWVGIEPVEVVAQRETGCGAGPYELRMTGPLSREVRACGQSIEYALACEPASCAWARGAAAGLVVQSEPGTSVVMVGGEGGAADEGEADAPDSDAPPAVQLSAAEALQTVFASQLAAVRRCAGGQPLEVRVRWGADGVVSASLAGPSAGSPIEQCVRDAVGPLSLGGVSAPGELVLQF